MPRDPVAAFRAPAALLQRLDELAAHRQQHRGALLRDLVEQGLAGGDISGPDLSDPEPGEGLRLLAARARGGEGAAVRELARLQERQVDRAERVRLAREARDGVDELEEIWGDGS